MAKSLRVNPHWDPDGGWGGANYRLPDDTDLEDLQVAIENAMSQGEGLPVSVDLGDDRRYYSLILNTRHIHSVLVGETAESHDQGSRRSVGPS